MESAVVKIFTSFAEPNFHQPWQNHSVSEKSGSGFVYAPGRILTNAHVISYHKFILVRKNGNNTPYVARVLLIGHTCDLAILTVEDPRFFDDIQIPPFADTLPDREEAVTVLGYPVGGDKLCSTRGVVSRLEWKLYLQAEFHQLAIQVDASINSGNSGGPAFNVHHRVVGVVFQTMTDGQSIGYLIPVDVVRHFLEDSCRIHDLDGQEINEFPTLGIEIQPMIHDCLRRHKGLTSDQTGVLVTKVAAFGSCDKLLLPGDVILSIEKYSVDNLGEVLIREQETVCMEWVARQCYVGDNVDLTILRDKQTHRLSIPLKPDPCLVPYGHTPHPRYFIFGGLVFTLLTVCYMREWSEYCWESKAPCGMYHKYKFGQRKAHDEEVVVLSVMLQSKVNLGYHELEHEIVSLIHGVRVKHLSHAQELLNKPAETILIELEGGKQIILSADECAASNNHVLNTYKIPTR
jgi:S1-C subfamily serine protease